MVFKHSEECPLVGKYIENMINKIDLPKGVFSEVYGAGDVGEQLINQNIDLIWFTGSSKVGKHLYEIAGRKFIKAILEMGGSNPVIMFDDVDIDKVLNKIYVKRFLNCGQVCDAMKRLIVHKSVFDEVVEKFKKIVESKKIGNPKNTDTELGSLVAKRQLELLESQVQDSVKKGAKIVTGGKRPKNLKGAYYLPTIITNIKHDMMVWREETFGPVLVIVPFSSDDEAIRLANDTRYGLGAQVYTKNKQRIQRFASEIQAGTIDFNEGNHWQPCTPFGGYKDSGMGREHGAMGFRELCQIKVIAAD